MLGRCWKSNQRFLRSQPAIQHDSCAVDRVAMRRNRESYRQEQQSSAVTQGHEFQKTGLRERWQPPLEPARHLQESEQDYRARWHEWFESQCPRKRPGEQDMEYLARVREWEDLPVTLGFRARRPGERLLEYLNAYLDEAARRHSAPVAVAKSGVRPQKRYRSLLKRHIRNCLTDDPGATDKQICSYLDGLNDQDPGKIIPSGWLKGDNRSLTHAYRCDKKARNKMAAYFSKVRRDLGLTKAKA
jgi:hypothetical protein